MDTWLDQDYSSPTPSGVNWLEFGLIRGQISGATVQYPSRPASDGGDERVIKVAWDVARGGGFPQPHVRLADVVKETSNGGTTWTIGNYQQIWNSRNALQFAYLATNSNSEVGISLAVGGATAYPTPLVGFVGDSVLYAGNASVLSFIRYGDYSAIRKHQSNSKLFSVSDYFFVEGTSENSFSRIAHQYRLFGRTADVGNTF